MRTLKIIFSTLSTLSFGKLMKLLRLLVPHPLFSLMGLYATIQTFAITQKHFPKTHGSNGPGNAFRHALWSCLIMMYCSKISSPEKALDYCRRMTDLHEELFPNKPLETKMDLHNNQVGREFFLEMLPGIHRQFFEKNFFVGPLLEKTKKAQRLLDLEDDFPGELVYLTR